jgi:RNA-binding protein PNO1
MAHKSHRQKALQSQLEERPAISLITNDENVKKIKAKKTKSSTAATTTASALASSSMDVDGDDNSAQTQPQPEAQHVEDDDGDILLDNATASTSATPAASTSSGFKPLNLGAQTGVLKNEFRRIPIPPHRITPLKRDWVNLYTPMVEHLGLQVRMNMQRRAVELKVSQIDWSWMSNGISVRHLPDLYSEGMTNADT